MDIHRVALVVHYIQMELEFGDVGFKGMTKTGVHREKSLRARTRTGTNNTSNPRATRAGESNPGQIDGGGRLIVITTTPTLLSCFIGVSLT